MNITLTLRTSPDYSFLLDAFVEIFGKDLNDQHREHLSSNYLTDSFADYIINNYGSDAAAGMFIRVGRAAFYYWMRQYAAGLGWKEIEFRLLPVRTRIKRGLSDLITWMAGEKPGRAELLSNTDSWSVQVTGSDSHLDSNILYGMIQELTCWAGNGKFYPVRKLQCQADGADFCVFEVSNTPAD